MQFRIQQLQHFIAKLPEKKISFTLLLLIVMYVAFLSSQAFWLFWPKSQPATLTANTSYAKPSSLGVLNSQDITNLNLFGKANAAPKKVIEEPKIINDAPETSLNIGLTGVVAVDKNDKAGLAIIESQGTQDTYQVDDVVKGTRATIKQVFADRVILKVSNRFETLMLDGINFSKTVSNNKKQSIRTEHKAIPRNARIIQATQNADVKREIKNKRAELVKNPGKLFDYIRVSPSRVNGELVGYKLRPGKDPALFKKMGLKHNDLATSINGFMLTDMKQAMAAINELRTAQSATISINRKGEQLEVLFSLD
ncbi:type II secretion system protein GspC [Pseudoalteromonas denitrificans]|jgi:general secretion pathway protein C|uniref:Type II secretion system protein C (GspC) n=1 Tax=Pseudoalteromonas denitrificans DSM 6059 TaxID=1123010 RepID=A0A1I1QHA0_9GAMM|nr:type II secretion system protein GspC [Pseudoalteromonas denitrificans]SFD21425.1 type II secretion system protein C (GspC) [Pseudoalteromonas denitrificans DSM 6059]